MGIDPNRIWDYYLRAAEATGNEGKEEGKENSASPFSVRSFFRDSPAAENRLVRAYLGYEEAMAALPWEEGEAAARELRLEDIVPNPGLKDAQLRAIRCALTSPLTIVQGPPGTGKTETIANLLACIHTLYPERTTAMVSCNNSAVDNVAEKLLTWAESDEERKREVLDAFSYMGSKARRKAWLKEIGMEGSFGEDAKPDGDYLTRRPLFTSTIHSLKRCFRGENRRFDYVIVDEGSQVSCLLGVLAMGCAEHLVIFGDPMQLPPVITEAHERVSQEFPELRDTPFADRQEHSFMDACRERFPQAPFVLLDVHFRCHPVITGFFNRYYEGRLEYPAPVPGEECPIHIRWYEGDYWEIQGMKPVPRQGREFRGIDREGCRILYIEKNNGAQLRTAYVNERQIAVFLREEWPELRRRLAEDRELTACILSPYVYQLFRLRQELEQLGVTSTLTDEDGEAGTLPQLSIHEAQGKEFDIVYYLPVEDEFRENAVPRSQEKHAVNVAVSRAIREFRIITSARWLPADCMRQALGWPPELLHPEEEKDERLQLSALIRYAMSNGAVPVRSGIRSVFDAIPRIRREQHTGENGGPVDSAPALCMEAALEELKRRPGVPFFSVSREVPLAKLIPRELRQAEEGENGEWAERLRFLLNSQADFVLRRPDGLPLVIEVDGSYHRSSEEQKRCDELKDEWLHQALGERGLLRFPTDGTTENETETILDRMAEEPDRERNWPVIRNELTQYLWRRLNEGKEALDRACGYSAWMRGEGELNAELIRSLKRLDYTRPDETDFQYGDENHNRFYFCRYGVAYAFEYAFLYKALLQDYLRLRPVRRDGTQDPFLGVTSLGCGSLLDAWALAYARAALAAEGVAGSGELALYYRGSDLADWAVKLLQPQENQYYRCGSAAEPEPRQVDDTFQRLWLFTGEVPEELTGDTERSRQEAFSHSGSIIQQAQWKSLLNYNILTFPKILNELSDDVMARFIEHLRAATETRGALKDRYYLCVSHSKAGAATGAARVERLIQALFPDFTAYDVLADYPDPLMAYLERSEGRYPYYVARDGIADGDARPYFSNFNPDFRPYDAYSQVFQLIWDFIEDLNDREELAVVEGERVKEFHSPILYPSQMAVQLIRLERQR